MNTKETRAEKMVAKAREVLRTSRPENVVAAKKAYEIALHGLRASRGLK